MTVKIQSQNIFIVNYFTVVQKSIRVSPQNYNFKFLSTLGTYLHKLKLTSCCLSHSQKIHIRKNMYYICLYFSKISGKFISDSLENLENSGNFTLKFLSKPCLVTRTISKFSKMHLSNFPNRPPKHVISSTD